jgi:7,8-dihydropterin-6-yl-methyl-4-(beta-D-ribofuranosyl)aminobenzene 5'-phosphate synthase
MVLTGCGHSGAVNIVQRAQRLTGVPKLHPLLGGLHLSSPTLEPIIDRAASAGIKMTLDLVVPGHLPNVWVAASSGSSFRLAAP